MNASGIKVMNAPLTAIGNPVKLAATMREIGRDARAAARTLALAPAAQKNRALTAMAKAVRGSRAALLVANAEDVAKAKAAGATPAFLDRLTLTPERIEAMAKGLDAVRKLADPVGTVLASWRRPERHAHRTRAGAARRGRRHLRKPAQRYGRCRRALPESRQCRDLARRFGKLPLDRRPSTPP